MRSRSISLSKAVLVLALAAAAPVAAAYINAVFLLPTQLATGLFRSAFARDLLGSAGNLPQYGEIQRRARNAELNSNWLRVSQVSRLNGDMLYESMSKLRASDRRVSYTGNGFKIEFGVPAGDIAQAVHVGATPSALWLSVGVWSLLCFVVVGPHQVGRMVRTPLWRPMDPRATAEVFFALQDEASLAGLTHDSGVGHSREQGAIPVGAMIQNARRTMESARAGDREFEAPPPTLDRASAFLDRVEEWMGLGKVSPSDVTRHPFDDDAVYEQWGKPGHPTTFRHGVVLPFKQSVRFNGLGNPSESTTLTGIIEDAVQQLISRGTLSEGQVDLEDVRTAVVDFYSDTPTVARAVRILLGSLAKHGQGCPLRLRLDDDERDDEGRTVWSYTLRIEQPECSRLDKTPRRLLRTGNKLTAARNALAGYADYHVAAPFSETGPIRFNVMSGNTEPLHPEDDPTAFAHVLTFHGISR